MDISAIAAAYEPTFTAWQNGYHYWGYLFYGIGALAVTLPAVVAAGLPRAEFWRRTLAAASAVLVAIFAWLHPGERATAHEHAYLCMEMALDALRAGAFETVKDFKSEADRCARFIDYDYVDKLPR